MEHAPDTAPGAAPVAVTASSFPLPTLNPRVFVHNELPDKTIHVIVTPNEDYTMAELYVGLASLASGGVAIVKTTSDLFLLLRTLSFLKNSKGVIDKLKGVLPTSTVTLRPGERVEVFDIMKKNPFWFTNPTDFISMFGGETVSLLIIQEDLKNSVKFNTALDKYYTVIPTGVSEPKHFHYWNGGALPVGINSSAPPSLIRFGDDMLLFYRHDRGDAIFVAEFKEGKFVPKSPGKLNQDTSSGVAVSAMQGNLCVVGRHSKGNQMFALWKKDDIIPWYTQEWEGTYRWQGIDISGNPSATTVGDKTFMVARHAGMQDMGAVMWSILWVDGTVKNGFTKLFCSYQPAVHAFKGKLCLVFVHPFTRALCMATSIDGQEWTLTHSNGIGGVSWPQSSAGVALTVYKDRLYVFYRDGGGNGVFYAWTEDGFTFHFPPNEFRYFGFDVEWEPTASPMPGENNGIMVAGIRPPGKKFYIFSDTAEVMAWTTLIPYEGE